MRTQGTIWQRENDGRNCSTCTQTKHATAFFIKSDNNRENGVLWKCNSSLRSTYYQKCNCALLHKPFVTFTSSAVLCFFCGMRRQPGRECRGASGELPVGSGALQQTDPTGCQQKSAGHHLHTGVVVSAHQCGESAFTLKHTLCQDSCCDNLKKTTTKKKTEFINFLSLLLHVNIIATP